MAEALTVLISIDDEGDTRSMLIGAAETIFELAADKLAAVLDDLRNGDDGPAAHHRDDRVVAAMRPRRPAVMNLSDRDEGADVVDPHAGPVAS